MAFRTWAKLSGTAIGAAALAGASQLGLAYGLGVVRFTRVIEVTERDVWTAQLAWVAWIAMTAAAIGGMTARSRLPKQAGAGTRIAAALAAGLGATAVMPLTMQPARTAQVTGVHPAFVIGVCAGLGALAGILAAYAALSRAVARWSLTTLIVAVWVIAIASVAPSLAPGSDELPAARLGVFDAAFLDDAITRRTALLTMPVLALLCGVVLGLAARRRQLSTWTIALAGLPGPALFTAAYLIAGPGSGPDRYEMVPYWGAMTAAGAGVLGSVLVAVLRRGPEGAGGRTRPPASAEPTPDRPPLPRRDAQAASSAIAEAAAAAAKRPDEQLRPSDTGVMKLPPDTGLARVPDTGVARVPDTGVARVPDTGVARVSDTGAARVPDTGAGVAAVPHSGAGVAKVPDTGVVQMPPFDGFAAAHQPHREPQAVNAPPAPPQPVTAPLPVTPVPHKDDGDFVNWVSGLGKR